MDSFRPNWAFYPLHGIEIIPDDTPIDHSLMFDDATIISKDEIDKVLSFFDEKDTRTQNHYRMLLQMVARDSDSIVVIREYDEEIEDVQKKADWRLLEIVSAVSNILLFYSDFQWTCCLPDEHILLPQTETIILHQSKGQQQQISRIATRGYIFFTPKPAFKITRTDLQKRLLDSRFKDFSSYLYSPLSKGSKKLIRSKIAAASIHLYRCLNSISPELQLIGAVTAIEVLISHASRQEKYEKIIQRLEQMIGKYAFDFYGANEVFSNRHKCIHQGQKIEKEYAYIALRLAYNCLINYSMCIQNFSGHNEMIECLDLLYQFEKFTNSHSSNLLDRTFTKHTRSLLPSDIVDPLPFYLSNYALGSYLQKHNIEEQKTIFATYTCVLSILRNLSIEESFGQLLQSCIYSPLPFNHFSTFSSFYNVNQESLEAEANEKVAYFRVNGWTWKVNKYKWEKDN